MKTALAPPAMTTAGGSSAAARKARPRSASASSINSTQSRTSLVTPANSAAVEIAIDAYASRVIQRNSPPESFVDTSLGPYITAMLRCANLQDEQDIAAIPEYESLIELLQDQCNMSGTNARTTLFTIARAICTQFIPDDRTFASFQSLGEALKEAAEQAKIANTITTNTDASESSSLTPANDRKNRAASISTNASSSNGDDSPAVLLATTPVPDGSDVAGTVVATPSAKATNRTLGLGAEDSTDDDVAAANANANAAKNSGTASHDEVLPSAVIHPYTPNPAGGPSPLKPDALIPVDLLGALDDPSPHVSRQKSLTERVQAEQEEAFPPLGAAGVSKPKKNDKPSRIKKSVLGSGGKNKNGAGANQIVNESSSKSNVNSKAAKNVESNKDIAAALFKPARPRQNSISESALTPTHLGHANDGRAQSYSGQSVSNGSISSAGSSASIDGNGGPRIFSAAKSSPHATSVSQQQLESSAGILLGMNSDLCQEAAFNAVTLTNGDYGAAQYAVDAARNAPPICRHMLNDGCYRSDCAFSHDVEGHTCLFWMRGRCTKGSNCKFSHGFHPKLLDSLKGMEVQPKAMPGSTQTVPLSLITGARRVPMQSPNSTPTAGFGSPFGPSLASPSTGPTNDFPLLSSTQSGFSGSSPASASSVWQASPRAGSTAQSHRSFSASSMASTRTHSTTSMLGDGAGSVPAKSSRGFSFANIASKGYDGTKNFASNPHRHDTGSSSLASVATVRIPQDLWNPHENRDASVFYIPDPIERYNTVATTVKRADVIDLHFQSTKTFPVVLSQILPDKLTRRKEVWIVTGTGHHVGSKTHQKGGGALERAVLVWLDAEGYRFYRGKDRNGLGGAILVKQS